MCHLIQLYELHDFRVLPEDFVRKRMKELTKRDEQFGPCQRFRLRYKVSVGIDATREFSPGSDFFSVSAGTSAMAEVQAFTMNRFI